MHLAQRQNRAEWERMSYHRLPNDTPGQLKLGLAFLGFLGFASFCFGIKSRIQHGPDGILGMVIGLGIMAIVWVAWKWLDKV